MDFHTFISNGKQQDSAVVFNDFQKLLKFLKVDPLFYAIQIDVHSNIDVGVLVLIS